MDKEKMKEILWWSLIIVIIILTIITLFNKQKIPETVYKDGEWDYGWMCSQYKFFSLQDAEKGSNCRLEDCQTIQENPKVERCTCLLNNLSVDRICVSQFYIRNYDWITYNKPQQINISGG